MLAAQRKLTVHALHWGKLCGHAQGRTLGLGVSRVNSWGMTMLRWLLSTERPVPCNIPSYSEPQGPVL